MESADAVSLQMAAAAMPNSTSTPPSAAAAASFLSWLPLELKCRTVAFLSPTDAVAFSEQLPEHGVTVTRLRPDRCVFARTPPLPGDIVTGDQPRCCNYYLPVLKASTHSLTVKFNWHDQGFGNRKGLVYIVALSKNSNESFTDATAVAAENLPFGGGRLVCKTLDPAPHENSPCELSFCPRDGEIYQLWYSVGSGGAHLLYLDDCQLQTCVFEDAQRIWSHNYQRLHELGVIGMEQQEQSDVDVHRIHIDFTGGAMNVQQPPPPESDGTADHRATRGPRHSFFYPKMLLHVCKSLRRQLVVNEATTLNDDPFGGTKNTKKRIIESNRNSHDQLDRDLVEIMSDHEIPVTDISLRAVEEIVQADMDERNRSLEDRQRRENQRRELRQRPDARDMHLLAALAFARGPGGGAAGRGGERMAFRVPGRFVFGGGPVGGVVVGGGVIGPADFGGGLVGPADVGGILAEEMQRQMMNEAPDRGVPQPPAPLEGDNGQPGPNDPQQFHEMMMQAAGMININIQGAMERAGRRIQANLVEEDNDDTMAVDR